MNIQQNCSSLLKKRILRKLTYIALLLFTFSCDDGDIIVTSFEFDDVNLQLCEGAIPNEFVFFKINTSTNEAISYNFIETTYSERAETAMPITINLEDPNNALVYRQFNTSITADYYCSSIPDSGIRVTEELVSTSGTAEIINQIINEDDNDGIEAILESPNSSIDPQDDPDEDGVPNYLDDDMANNTIGDENNSIEEGYNSDDDMIPDFKDQDDDNDNILTSAEFPNGDPNDDSPLDTDGDNTPNYKDDDDDGDGILTRNEDINGNGNPRDDDTDNDGIPNYLDNDDDGDGILTINDTDNPILNIPPNLPNTVSTIFRTTVLITELKFNEEVEQFTENQFSFGFRDVTVQIPNN